ncbi:unnamed protein product [Fusarium graminearum]|uniref:Chromosome 1, complete genome n=1 Tax=Gibberella zeae (strain ATCC MYA-4620 / CBS 123657 / FGSC 9075 / NRRL 31084 / PH-1) TaxID=229533 RepID=A0A098D173_GIBZE|nr:unnamed protein product [Fusarium graminearum]CZS75442.1 unnamed protein product [Fusarium graminearum]
MNQFREINITISPRTNTTGTVVTKKNKKSAWSGCIFSPIKTWATNMFGNKPVYIDMDDESEPLLDERRRPRTTQTVSSFVRRAASRTIRKYSRLP